MNKTTLLFVIAFFISQNISAQTDLQGEFIFPPQGEHAHSSSIVETPEGVLHFKSDCSLLDEESVLTTDRLARSGVFKNFKQIIVPEGEEPAANALRVNGVVMVGNNFPRTIERLDAHGHKVVPLQTTEIGKLDAGLSCMSLRWRRPTV